MSRSLDRCEDLRHPCLEKVLYLPVPPDRPVGSPDRVARVASASCQTQDFANVEEGNCQPSNSITIHYFLT